MSPRSSPPSCRPSAPAGGPVAICRLAPDGRPGTLRSGRGALGPVRRSRLGRRPHDGADPAAVTLVARLAADAGAALVTQMSPQAHDDAVAAGRTCPSSRPPWSRPSCAVCRRRRSRSPAGGLRDVTRIAASEPGLWTQILAGNAASVRDVLVRLQGDLSRVVEALDQVAAGGSEGALEVPGPDDQQWQRRPPSSPATRRRPHGMRDRLGGRPGHPGQPRPPSGRRRGHRVNLEDLRLDHGLGQPFGIAEVAVVPQRRSLLRPSWSGAAGACTADPPQSSRAAPCASTRSVQCAACRAPQRRSSWPSTGPAGPASPACPRRWPRAGPGLSRHRRDVPGGDLVVPGPGVDLDDRSAVASAARACRCRSAWTRPRRPSRSPGGISVWRSENLGSRPPSPPWRPTSTSVRCCGTVSGRSSTDAGGATVGSSPRAAISPPSSPRCGRPGSPDGEPGGPAGPTGRDDHGDASAAAIGPLDLVVGRDAADSTVVDFTAPPRASPWSTPPTWASRSRWPRCWRWSRRARRTDRGEPRVGPTALGVAGSGRARSRCGALPDGLAGTAGRRPSRATVRPGPRRGEPPRLPRRALRLRDGAPSGALHHQKQTFSRPDGGTDGGSGRSPSTAASPTAPRSARRWRCCAAGCRGDVPEGTEGGVMSGRSTVARPGSRCRSAARWSPSRVSGPAPPGTVGPPSHRSGADWWPSSGRPSCLNPIPACPDGTGGDRRPNSSGWPCTTTSWRRWRGPAYRCRTTSCHRTGRRTVGEWAGHKGECPGGDGPAPDQDLQADRRPARRAGGLRARRGGPCAPRGRPRWPRGGRD